MTTGDGLLAALQVLDALVTEDRPASEVTSVFEPVPQLLRNVRYDGRSRPLDMEAVKAAIAAGESRLGPAGRLVIRNSGTEPLIRVMGEAEDPELLAEVVDEICTAVERATA